MVYSMKEIKKMMAIEAVIDGIRTGKEASKVLNLSERQVWRLVKKVREKGTIGIKHGNCNRSPKNKIPSDIVNKIIELKKSPNYENINFSYFRDLLEEKENIIISYSCLYNIMKDNGFVAKNKDKVIPRRRKIYK